MAYDTTEGIAMENLDEYVEMLKDILKLDNNACKSLKAMKLAQNKEQLVNTIKVEDEVSSSYGYIMMCRDAASNTISCAYAVHSLELKLADKTVATTKTRYFCGFIPIGEEVKFTKEKGKEEIRLVVSWGFGH